MGDEGVGDVVAGDEGVGDVGAENALGNVVSAEDTWLQEREERQSQLGMLLMKEEELKAKMELLRAECDHWKALLLASMGGGEAVNDRDMFMKRRW